MGVHALLKCMVVTNGPQNRIDQVDVTDAHVTSVTCRYDSVLVLVRCAVHTAVVVKMIAECHLDQTTCLTGRNLAKKNLMYCTIPVHTYYIHVTVNDYKK